MPVGQYFIALLLLLSSAFSNAATLKLANNFGSMPVVPHAEVFLDNHNQLTIEEIQNIDQFSPSGHQDISFGFTHARIWYRFSIENTSPHNQSLILYLRQFLLDDIRLYSLQDDAITVQHQGRFHLDKQSKLPSRFFSFSIELPPNTTRDFYLSLQSVDAISTPLTLTSTEDFQKVMVSDAIVITLYAGLILTNLFFALFMLGALREIEIAYYVGFLVFHHLIGIMMLEGVPAALFGFDNLFWNRTGFIFLVNVAITMAVLFSRSFLKLKKNMPQYYRFSHLLLALMIFSCIQCLVLPHFYGSLITTIVCMIVGIGIEFLCIRCASRKERVARLFLLSWSCGIAGATIYGLKIWDMLPINWFTTYAWHIGTALESVLFSYTIADRVSLERKRRLTTQTELAERERALRVTQERLLQTETAAKQDLEQQVHERTKDITRILGELESQNKVLTELSINDGLTRVRNRRFFNDIYPELWNEAIQKSCWISVILIDIDHFKSVNDNYGHLLGDQCLVSVATGLKQVVSRPTDVICRYGGEEFIIVLLDTDQQAATRVAQRLRSHIADLVIETERTNIRITASLGVAGITPKQTDNPLQLISDCDKALYQSKEKGRNQVTTASSS